MNVSEAGIRFVASWEGWRASAYRDVGGKLTIGYGHLVKPGELFGTLSEDEGRALLRADLAIAETAVNALGVELTQPQFDALVSFAFNLGAGILNKGHTLADALRHGADDAADAFVLYDHVNGVENAGLKARRLAEKALFETPTNGEDCPVTPRSA